MGNVMSPRSEMETSPHHALCLCSIQEVSRNPEPQPRLLTDPPQAWLTTEELVEAQKPVFAKSREGTGSESGGNGEPG